MPDLEQQSSAGHEALVADALQEGELDARLGELAGGDEDLTADQLRTALGDLAEGLSDDELQAEWKKAQAAESAGGTEGGEATGGTQTPAPEPLKLEGFKLYDDKGVEIADPSKVTAFDLLTGKVQIGYNAFKGEQRKALRDLTRVASLGHYNEKQITDLRLERGQAMQRAIAAEAKANEALQLQRIWDQALTALINGNPEPIQRLALTYQQKLASGGLTPAVEQEDSAAIEAAGQEYVLDTIIPAATEIAVAYGAKPNEVSRYALHLMQQEGQFLTEEKIVEIMQYALPAALEAAGYTANGAANPTPAADPRDSTIADLTKRLAALEASKANESTERVRGKSKKAPPSGGGSTSGGETVPQLRNRDDMKRYLRGESE